MTPNNQNISLNQQGKDVVLLHGRLINIGYTIETSEIINEFFGQSTHQAVIHFQQVEGLSATGVVDSATAQAIMARAESGKTFILSKPSIPPQAATSAPTGPGEMPGEPSEIVRESTSPPEEEREPPSSAQGVPDAGKQVQKGQEFATPGEVNGATDSAKGQATDEVIYTVVGTVSSPDSAGVDGLSVLVVDKNVGPDILLDKTTTDQRGRYQASFPASRLLRQGKELPDLQARVLVGKTFLAASEVRYNASTNETLNVKLPANSSALPSEYETLMATLAAHYKGRLGDLQETGDQQDVTYLANKTGWDARAVALAAPADQFSRSQASTKGTADGGIKPEFYYALFRAGLPANTETLYLADPQAVGAVWKQAIAQGVIPQALANEIPAAIQAFQALSAARALDAKHPVGLSSLKELLQLTLGEDTQRQEQFADLYVRYQNDLPTFWSHVEQSFGPKATKRLQLDGQLGYLTLNNVPLIERLHNAEQQNPLTSTLDLAQRGYYQAVKWKPLLDGAIPAHIPGSTPDEQRVNYAELLAAQVCLAFPTAVVADIVRQGTVTIPGEVEVQNGITSFLAENQGKFEIGIEPVERYLARTKLSDRVDSSVVAQIKRLQRVYQITPTDQAFTALLQHNLDSAYQITRYDATTFVRKFREDLGGEAVANLVYARAQQVYGTVLNLATTYLAARRAPTLGSDPNAFIINPFSTGRQAATTNGATSATNQPATAPHAATSSPGRQEMTETEADSASDGPGETAPVVANQTLEGLFGSLDYCSCDECRSILSPAAYLVDLLQFIDCQSPHKQNPQDVLFSRRPDIQYLPLTCENTNIKLPYIDLVNETLEYFVANNLSPSNYGGHNTDGTISSDELLANPQFVNEMAYTTLEHALFPPPLPFHRSLELLRLHFQKFGVPLQDAMAALRPSDALERGTAAYGWRDILMEQLGLSRVEYQILTDSTLTLAQIYGYPEQLDNNAVITALSSFQDFCRRVGVSYDDLASILKTQFINPNSTLIPRLERLKVPFTTLAALKNGTISDSTFETHLLPVGLNPAEYGGSSTAVLSSSGYGGVIAAWVKNPTNYARIMGLITITSTSADPCSAADLQLGYANSGPDANTLHAIDFVRLLRFIRLWKKLGLTIEQTDNIITALAPSMSTVTSLGDLDTAFLALLPRIGFAYRVLTQLSLSADTDLAGLLACWGPIGLYGAKSLYASMFLNPTILRQDPAFAPDAYSNLLQDPTQTIMATPICQKAVVGGTMTERDTLTTTINGVSIVYTVGASDTSPELLARSVAAAVNATTTVDPITGLPLNQVISATNAAGVITFNAVAPGGAFTLACSVSPGATETYVSLDHAPALRAAFNLTANEFALITQALNFNETTVLNLANISAIYRRGWMARKLGLSVVEFLLLTQFTGLDPFATPDPGAAPAAEPPAIRLIRLLQALRAANLRPVQALYLIWNEDISGESASLDADIMSLARTLRADFAAVESQFTLVDDPNGDIAKSLMTLVYGADAANFYFGLLNNTLAVSTSYSIPQPTPQPIFDPAAPQPMLAQAILNAANGRLSYDDLRKRLTYTGVLDATTLAALNAAISANPPSQQPQDEQHLQDAVAALSTANHRAVDPFFGTYPELLPLYTAYVASNDSPQKKRAALLAHFLPYLKARRKQEQALAALTATAGTDSSFAPALLNNVTVLHAATDSTLALINDLTAIEKPGLSAQFFLTNNPDATPDQTIDSVSLPSYVQSATIAGPITINDILTTMINGISIPYTVVAADTTPAVLAGHVAAAINAMAPINRVISASASGSVIAIMGIDPSGANNSFSLACRVSAGATETYASGSPIAGTWRGYLDVPQNGSYNILVTTDAGAWITLKIGDVDAHMAKEPEGSTAWRNTQQISLTAGSLSAFVLTVTGLTNTLTVSWQGAWQNQNPGLGMQVIPAPYLYSATLIERLRTAYVRFLKATSLATALSLTADEIVYLATNGDFQINEQGWLNALPVSGTPDTSTDTGLSTATSLRDRLSGLLTFARLKAALSPNDGRLLAVLENPEATSSDDALLKLTRWNDDSLDALLNHFFTNNQHANLAHLENFRRVYDAYAVVTTCGISAAVLIDAATNDPQSSTVSTLQSALRALYARADWLAVIKPINDTMRDLQRDALVAYVLQHLGDQLRQQQGDQPTASPINVINTPEKLFEYLLMDVEMEPCMQTSRIRHALSSVQLFIERCLRNLEQDVDPNDLSEEKRAQWTWMKRYRVWQANREVFLWPENWLEPELRDDQSQIFKDTMSELLQSDITDDTATTAFLNYLSKLEEVAKLEPCGIYYMPSDPGQNNEKAHAVARTAGAQGKYYYRRLEAGIWTPWEEIKLNIEDTPVVPVVWNDRLLLFWLKILQQTPVDPAGLSNSTPPAGNQASVNTAGSSNSMPRAGIPTQQHLNDLSLSDVQSAIGRNASAQTQVTVQAVLCWSEYYNGKWQSTKTSDVNRPTFVGIFPPAGEWAFNRSKLQLRAAPLANLPNNDILLVQTGVGYLTRSSVTPQFMVSPGFVLYNTHSLPVRTEDVVNPSFNPQPRYRGIQFQYPSYESSTFSIFYEELSLGTSPIRNDLLETNIGERVVEPQPDVPDVWDAPFFLEDSRNVFYVTTSEAWVPILKYIGVGLPTAGSTVPNKRIPPLVIQQHQMVPHRPDPVITSINPGVSDPSLIQRYVDSGVNIWAGIGTTGVVNFAGQEMGAMGNLANERP